MKEKIYTIPINESFEQNCECPFCYLEKKFEKEAVEYALGPAMMEPDYRIISNEKGYCNKHFSMMLAMPNKLSLALVLDTHLKEIMSKLEKYENTINTSNLQKNGFLKKNRDGMLNLLADETGQIAGTCVICDKLKDNLERYIDVFFYMWEKDAEFRDKVINSKGFCIKHFSILLTKSQKHLKKPQEFLKAIYKSELDNLRRINDDIHKFTLKFDYRNKDMEWGSAIDAPVRSIEKISGYTLTLKEDN